MFYSSSSLVDEITIFITCVFAWFTIYGLLYIVVQDVVAGRKKIGGTSVSQSVLRDVFFAPQSQHPAIISRYISSIHAIATSIIGIKYLLWGMELETWYTMQMIPLSYCVYDLIIYFGEPKLRTKDNRWVPLHHFLFGMLVWLGMERYPIELAVGYLMEISTPLLNMAYTMLKTKSAEKYPELFNFFAIGTIVTFGIFRVLGCFVLCVVTTRNREYVLLPLVVTLWVMNINWFLKLLQKRNTQS